MIEVVVVVIYWTECMPRKFGNETRLPGTIGIDNLPIPLTLSPAGLQSSFSSFFKKIIRIQDFKKMHSNH